MRFRKLQSFNAAALAATTSTLLRRPGLLLPHVSIKHVSRLDVDALRAAGVGGLVLDKDNTLTPPYLDAEPDADVAALLSRARAAFGADKVVVLSNSAGSGDDVDFEAAAASEKALGLPVVRRPSGDGISRIWRCYVLQEDVETSRDPAAATDLEFPWRRVAAPPRPRTWIFLGDESRHRPGGSSDQRCKSIPKRSSSRRTRLTQVRHPTAQKPTCPPELLDALDAPDLKRVAVVGDRVATDVLLANLHGAVSARRPSGHVGPGFLHPSRSVDGSRRRRGDDVDSPWTSRGDAAATTRIVRGEGAAPRRGRRG